MATKNPKLFAALLNGVLKKEFEKDPEITDEFLKQEIFKDASDVTLEDVTRLVGDISEALKTAASNDWESTDLETYLKKSKFANEQQEIISKFWKVQKQKIHDLLVKNSIWNDSLNKMSWRIDSKTKSRRVPEMNDELTAIVELVVGQKQQSGGPQSQVVRFEMDRVQLKQMMTEITFIQTQINKFKDQTAASTAVAKTNKN